MKWIGYALLSMLLVVTVIVINHPFVLARPLDTEGAKASEITDTFTLILYGGRYFDDVETIASLDLEGDQYTFEPYAPVFDYRVEKGLPAKKALERAEEFVNGSPYFWRPVISRVLDDQGKTIGYEVRSLYRPLNF